MEVLYEKLRSLHLSDLEPLPNATKLISNFDALEQAVSRILPALPVAVRQMDRNGEAQRLMEEVTKLAHQLETLLNKLQSEVRLARDRLRVRDYSARLRGCCFNPSFFTCRRLQKRLASVTAEFRKMAPYPVSGKQPDREQKVIYGRVDDLQNIVDQLLSSQESIAIVCIVGSPGIGKTTLARLAYQDKLLNSNIDFRTWIYVSGNFDAHRVTQALLEELAGTQHPRLSHTTDLASLQQQLRNCLSNRRFFFVLDHVGEIDTETWASFTAPLADAAPGSRILMTAVATDANTPLPVSSLRSYKLDRLKEEYCWPLLASVAFPSKEPHEYSELEPIGKELVQKFKGQPRAIKVIGGILKDEMAKAEWERVLGGTDLQLLMDYDDFTPTLKRCFAYCTVLPKDYKVSKETLIQLWIAEDLVPDHGGTTTFESIAAKYFLNLVSKSFILYPSEDEGISMEPPVSSLARNMFGKACFPYNSDNRVPGGRRGTSAHVPDPDSIQYIPCTFDISLKFEDLSKYTSLRTLLLVCSPTSGRSIYSDQVIPNDLFVNFPELRTLSLSGLPMQTLPGSIGKLLQLRFLDLSHTLIEKLPESTITLCIDLLTLKLNDCGSLTELPSMDSNINLRHLDISRSKNIKAMPREAGRLTNLHSLSNFIVRDVPGSHIQEVADLVHLSGKLLISGLQNVIDSLDAKEANLENKIFLRELDLQWTAKFSELRNQNVETEVLEYLKPCSSLGVLRIICYGGRRFPQWISLSDKLVNVTLSNCRNCDNLPLLGKLPSLRVLSIEGIDEVKRIDAEFCGDVSQGTAFPSLETLEFKNMPSWEEWSFGPAEIGVLPRLMLLKLERCPKLKEFKVRVEDLRMLTINECQELTAFSLGNVPSLLEVDIQNCSNLKEIPHSFPSLTKLRIWGCQMLISLSKNHPIAATDKEFPCLRELDIQNCTSLKELPSEFALLEKLRITKCRELLKISTCSKLHDVILEECDKLKLLNEVELSSLTSMVIHQLPEFVYPSAQFLKSLSKLINLEITKCVNLEALTDKRESGSQGLCSLERLVIQGCPKLEQFPNMLSCFSSLKELIVVGCEALEFFPEMALPPVLKRLVIGKCTHLKSLPPKIFNNQDIGLEFLEVNGCPALLSLSEGELPLTLRLLWISECTGLKSLPAGLSKQNASLTSLRIWDCHSVKDFPAEGLPCNIRSLSVINCGNFKPLSEWGLNKLQSLRNFSFGGCPELINLEGVVLPKSVGVLLLKGLPKLVSLSGLLRGLDSLDILTIRDCPRLEIRTEEKLPVSVSCLYVSNCPMLTQGCQSVEGSDRSKIAHIPLIEFDFHQY